jgi:membrane protein DedA with SNARE-associated domain
MELLSLETIERIAQSYGYWAVFLGILLESVGLPIPGETVTLAGGFLAGSQQLSYWLVLFDAAMGAAIGGNLGYWLGRKGGWPVMVKIGKLFRVQEAQLLGLKQQFTQNAVKAVFIGRFVALLRIFSSPLAGMVGMPYGQFFWVNTLGSLVWATVMVTLAYFAGQVLPLERLVELAGRFAAVTLAVIAALVILPLWWESRKAKADLDPVHAAIAAANTLATENGEAGLSTNTGVLQPGVLQPGVLQPAGLPSTLSPSALSPSKLMPHPGMGSGLSPNASPANCTPSSSPEP